MGDVINWGILGCGRIARKFVQSVRAVDDAQLVAVASRTVGKVESQGRDDHSGKQNGTVFVIFNAEP